MPRVNFKKLGVFLVAAVSRGGVVLYAILTPIPELF